MADIDDDDGGGGDEQQQKEAENVRVQERVEVARVYEQDKAGLSHADTGVTRGGASGVGASGYDEQELKREERVNEWLTKARARLAERTSVQHAAASRDLAARVAKLEVARDLSRVWFHIDMDAFYASCEVRADEKLRDVPFAVGGLGMITTANYAARAYGVRSAMPGFMGRKLCPQLVFVKPDFTKYTAAAEEVRECIREFDAEPLVVGLDEAYADVTPRVEERLQRVHQQGQQHDERPSPSSLASPTTLSSATVDEQFAAAEEVACDLKRRVREHTGLTCSIGFAPNRMLAKVCSDMRKPDGVFGLRNSREDILSFMDTLPVKKVSGIGRVTSAKLKGLAIETCGDVLRRGVDVASTFYEKSTNFIITAALGIGATEKPEPDDGDLRRKGISVERTFTATPNRGVLKAKLKDVASTLAADIRRHELRGKCVTLKMKTARFELYTRSKTDANFASIGNEDNVEDTAERLYKIAVHIFTDAFEKNPTSYRLLGIRLGDFVGQEQNEAGQHTLEVSFQNAQNAERRPLNKMVTFTTEEEARDSGAVDEEEDGANDATDAKEAATTSMGAGNGPSSSSFVICDLCGERVPNDPRSLQEHSDFHFALSLSATNGGHTYMHGDHTRPPTSRASTGSPHAKRAKKAPAAVDIRAFFSSKGDDKNTGNCIER